MHVPKGEIKMIIIESVHWLSQRGLITFHSMDVEGKTIRIMKAQYFEGGWKAAIMLFYFYR